MWEDKLYSQQCFKDLRLRSRNSPDPNESDEILPVDSAHVPPILRPSNASFVCGEDLRLPPQKVPITSTIPPHASKLNSPIPQILPTRSPASFVYGTRAPRRGTCLIISVDTFKPALCLPGRPGAEVDLRKLQQTFSMLDFDVKMYCNPTAANMTAIVEAESKANHADADTFVMVLLSHGDDGGLIYGTDGAVYLENLIKPFRGDSCPDLAGKPKMFFVQACRGSQLDPGTVVETDGFYPGGEGGHLGSLRRIPVEADLLVAYAVQPGYFAFRNSLYGSWFIQALTNCLQRYGRTLDLMSILTRVNHEVAYEFESMASNPEYSGKKQVSSIVSTLTKDVFFPPKKPSSRS
nr:unnamed protein product [Spirometra erinaceieuropaei]